MNINYLKVALRQHQCMVKQAAESSADFIHKMKMLLKELRESRVNLRIINEKPVIKHQKVEFTLKECNELIGIFTKSLDTAKKNAIAAK